MAATRRTQVEAIDDLTDAVRLLTQLFALSLPAAVLKHDDKKYTNPVTQAAVDQKNRWRAVMRAALGRENE